MYDSKVLYPNCFEQKLYNYKSLESYIILKYFFTRHSKIVADFLTFNYTRFY